MGTVMASKVADSDARDTITHYRQAIQEILTASVKVPISNGKIESQTVFDTQHDHYQVMNVGWDGYRRVHGWVLHLDIKDGKVWVQHKYDGDADRSSVDGDGGGEGGYCVGVSG
jgi:XisI protein